MDKSMLDHTSAATREPGRLEKGVNDVDSTTSAAGVIRRTKKGDRVKCPQCRRMFTVKVSGRKLCSYACSRIWCGVRFNNWVHGDPPMAMERRTRS